MKSILGIDVGNYTSKAAYATSANIENISVSTIEPSVRSLVSIQSRQRIVGQSAKAFQKQNPLSTIGSLKRLVGRAYSDAEFLQAERDFVNASFIDAGGVVGFEVDYCDDRRKFSGTQITATFLRQLVHIASQECQGPVSNIIIAVPTWYAGTQRRAVLDASFIAGLPRVGLISDIIAVALDYGISHTELLDHTSPRNVVFIDIGQSDYSVAVVTFSKDRMLVKSVSCDPHFGGRNIDHALARYFVEKFNSYEIDVTHNPRIHAALLAECQVVKEALSVTSETFFRFNAVAKDVFFKSRLTRDSFNDIISSLLGRIPGPLQVALSDAGIAHDSIHGIELYGGSTNIPAIKDYIGAFFRGTPISIAPDNDYAVARGATYACAMLPNNHSEEPLIFKNFGLYPIEIEWTDRCSPMNWTSDYDDPDQYRLISNDVTLTLLKEEEARMYAMDLLVSETEESRDALIRYISSLRDGLSTDYAEYCHPEEVRELLRLIDDTELWLVSARLEDMTKSAYDERRGNIFRLGNRIAERYREAQELPRAMGRLQELATIVFHSSLGTVQPGPRAAAVCEFSLDTLTWIDDQLVRQVHIPRNVDQILRVKEVTDRSNELVRIYTALIADQEQHGVDLRRQIAELRQMVQLTQGRGAVRASCVYLLGHALRSQFDGLGNLEDLQEALTWLEEAVKLTPDEAPEKAVRLRDLGSSYRARFTLFGEIGDIDRAISSYSEAVQVTPKDHPDRQKYLNRVGISCFRRFERRGDIQDIERAILSHSEALQLTPDGHPNKPSHLTNLGNWFYKRFEWREETGDLDKAVSYYEGALQILPDDDPDKPGLLSNFGLSLSKRFEWQENLEDLDRAILSHRRAVQITQGSHLDKPRCLNNLGLALFVRFERFGSVGDLDEAILSHRESVETVMDGHPDRPTHLNNLGSSLSRRFERLGDLADIKDAIVSYKNAVEITPDGHPDKPSRLTNLGTALLRHFEKLGDVRELDKAVLSHREAVQTTLKAHPDKASRLSNLGVSFLTRYGRLGEIGDLNKGVSCYKEAVEITPDNHPHKSKRLSNSGNSFLRRFKRLGDFGDLENAISSHTEVVRITPDGHPDKPICLNNLGVSFLTRFERLGNMADLDSAMLCHRNALQATQHDHSDKPAKLHHLGVVFFKRFVHLGDITDLNEAISHHIEAVQMPDSRPNKPGYLDDLGLSYLTRFEKLGDVSDLQQCISAYSEAAHSFAGPPSVRFRCAVSWSKCAHLLHDSSESALEAYACALDLLPRLAWLGLTIDSRYQELRSASTVACNAAATALMANDLPTALEWLEQGRSVVWGQMLQLRTPLDALRKARPDMAEKLAQISADLERGGSQDNLVSSGFLTEQEVSAEQTAQRQRERALEWEDEVRKVRELPGFEHFLQPKQCFQLLDAARLGPVVVLNISELRCDALVLTSPSEPLVHIPLVNFSYKRAGELQALLNSLLSKTAIPPDSGDKIFGTGSSVLDRDEDGQFRALLEELWTSVVKPVLDCLSIQQSRTRDHRRMWWCPTGPLTFLPIHAAGLYPEGSARALVSLADFAVSSYTPTLSALLTALQAAEDNDNDTSLLTVIHPGSSEMGRLPRTKEELKCIQKRASTVPLLVLNQSDAKVARVLSAMETYPWVHFACHGVQDPSQPTKSGLLLEDGRLELSQIIKKRLLHADFAFLSACQTAAGDRQVPDEAVHLAAGLLFAGYRSVVATMWSIRDNDAPLVADKVYGRLFGDGQPSSRQAALALHAAVQRLQQRYRGSSFASWVPFIHVGV